MTVLSRSSQLALAALLMSVLCLGGAVFVFAQEGQEGVTEINEEIQTKKANMDQINRKIDDYRKQIEKKQVEGETLQSQLDLLENRREKAELDIEVTEVEIDLVNTELRQLEDQVNVLEAQLVRQREVLKNILQEMQVYDNDMTLQVLFGADSFSDIFTRLQYLENVNEDLHDELEEAKLAKVQVEDSQLAQEGKKARLEELQKTLVKNREQLESELGAKESILSETQQSESQYRVLLYELRQEQSYIEQQINSLQTEIEQRLIDTDQAGDETLLSWPVPEGTRITATFHDPSYPFRHLFEHSGLDLAVPYKTALKSAAPGYVAWTRTGNQYGNFVMIVHANGIATLYAHMSSFAVEPDQFVSRGQIIGYSGGLPGTPGAGLSTGPHLHFEVRKNGIPVNPLGYLMSR